MNIIYILSTHRCAVDGVLIEAGKRISVIHPVVYGYATPSRMFLLFSLEVRKAQCQLIGVWIMVYGDIKTKVVCVG